MGGNKKQEPTWSGQLPPKKNKQKERGEKRKKRKEKHPEGHLIPKAMQIAWTCTPRIYARLIPWHQFHTPDTVGESPDSPALSTR
jgi:hypothetical protein